MTGISIDLSKPVQSRIACEQCSKAKTGCDKKEPRCARCLEKNIHCEPRYARRPSKASQTRRHSSIGRKIPYSSCRSLQEPAVATGHNLYSATSPPSLTVPAYMSPPEATQYGCLPYGSFHYLTTPSDSDSLYEQTPFGDSYGHENWAAPTWQWSSMPYPMYSDIDSATISPPPAPSLAQESSSSDDSPSSDGMAGDSTVVPRQTFFPRLDEDPVQFGYQMNNSSYPEIDLDMSGMEQPSGQLPFSQTMVKQQCKHGTTEQCNM